MRERAPVEAIRIVAANVFHERVKATDELPYGMVEAPTYYATNVLTRLGPPAGFQAIDAIIERFPTLRSSAAEAPLQALLGACFTLRETPLPKNEIGTEQRRALQAIADTDAMWNRRIVHVGGRDPLTACGLPNTREALRAFLG
ncbi:MAG TPA: hypothetical protein VFF73_31845 [Planctomycetota bacterium]|nr:hypothetical protein [Planctomycetota bacterium]